MKYGKNHPPKLALMLLNKLLPDSVKDDISGDLTEEFNHSGCSPQLSQFRFWIETISVCWKYSANKQLSMSLGLIAIASAISYMLIKAVIFLSVADDPLFLKEYWMYGDIHLLFAEDFFWSHSFGSNAYELDWRMLVHDWSVAWSTISFSALYLLNRRYKLGLFSYSILALVVCFTPYFYGMLTLRLNDVPLNEIGPLVAFMWISIIYLILPLSCGVIKKLHEQKNMIVA